MNTLVTTTTLWVVAAPQRGKQRSAPNQLLSAVVWTVSISQLWGSDRMPRPNLPPDLIIDGKPKWTEVTRVKWNSIPGNIQPLYSAGGAVWGGGAEAECGPTEPWPAASAWAGVGGRRGGGRYQAGAARLPGRPAVRASRLPCRGQTPAGLGGFQVAGVASMGVSIWVVIFIWWW